jgi:hypothetical protein
MSTITDDYMKQIMTTIKPFTAVILKKGPKYGPDSLPVIWEHARRNFELREDGKLSIVCPIQDESDITGIGVFSTDPEETKKIMNGDPGVQAGVFTYEIHATRSFPGDSLPA